MDKKKWIKHIPLLMLELTVLAAALCILYVTLKATDSKTGAEKVSDAIKLQNALEIL